MKRVAILKNLERPIAGQAGDDVLPTGSPSLDILLGGGWPAGVISELCGPPGYAEAIAYRTVAAVQHAYPGSLVVFCGRDFSTRRASQAGLDTHRLLVTHSQEAAVTARESAGACLVVIDWTLGIDMPVRADKQLSVLYLTRHPGDVRSTACVELAPCSGSRGWAWAERMWHTWRPDRLRLSSMQVCLGKNASVQEVLSTAVYFGIITARGRWYSHGRHRIGGSWEAAAQNLLDSADLRTGIMNEIAALAPMHWAWPQVYP